MSRAVIEIEGFVATEPEVHFTQAGDKVLGFSVAHTPRRRNKQSGEWEDAGPTTWCRIALWREDADRYEGVLRKGTAVVVKGEPEVRVYEGKNGPGANLEVRFARVSTVPPRGHSQGTAPAPQAQDAADAWAPPQDGEAWATPGLYGDDTPF